MWPVSAVQQRQQLLELGALPARAMLVVLLLIIVVGEESVMYL
jgi:hypothetical protein